MSEQLINSIVTIVVAIIGLATLAVVLSRGANTAGVISSASKGLATDIKAAVSPLSFGGLGATGGDFTID